MAVTNVCTCTLRLLCILTSQQVLAMLFTDRYHVFCLFGVFTTFLYKIKKKLQKDKYSCLSRLNTARGSDTGLVIVSPAKIFPFYSHHLFS